jgi:hypothetical protein
MKSVTAYMASGFGGYLVGSGYLAVGFAVIFVGAFFTVSMMESSRNG